MLIRLYQPSDQQAVDHYYLREDAKAFTGSPKEALDNATRQVGYTPFLCFAGKDLVVCFVLDSGEDKFIYTSEEASLLLRSFSVDSRYEGQGHGKAVLAQLPDLVRQHFPSVKEVVLGVNVKNERATNFYARYGFSDTGCIHQGPKGPQLIFHLPLENVLGAEE